MNGHQFLIINVCEQKSAHKDKTSHASVTSRVSETVGTRDSKLCFRRGNGVVPCLVARDKPLSDRTRVGPQESVEPRVLSRRSGDSWATGTGKVTVLTRRPQSTHTRKTREVGLYGVLSLRSLRDCKKGSGPKS